jgi:hypothetical protein
MKLLPAEFVYLATEREVRRNLEARLRCLAFVTAIVAVYTVVFHWIRWEVEGIRHSWITGLYCTLTVMTTLGFGDVHVPE